MLLEDPSTKLSPLSRMLSRVNLIHFNLSRGRQFKGISFCVFWTIIGHLFHGTSNKCPYLRESVIASVLVQSNLCNFFFLAGDLATVRIIGVCVIAGCPLGGSFDISILAVKWPLLPRVHVEKLKKRHSSERKAAFRILWDYEPVSSCNCKFCSYVQT